MAKYGAANPTEYTGRTKRRAVSEPVAYRRRRYTQTRADALKEAAARRTQAGKERGTRLGVAAIQKGGTVPKEMFERIVSGPDSGDRPEGRKYPKGPRLPSGQLASQRDLNLQKAGVRVGTGTESEDLARVRRRSSAAVAVETEKMKRLKADEAAGKRPTPTMDLPMASGEVYKHPIRHPLTTEQAGKFAQYKRETQEKAKAAPRIVGMDRLTSLVPPPQAAPQRPAAPGPSLHGPAYDPTDQSPYARGERVGPPGGYAPAPVDPGARAPYSRFTEGWYSLDPSMRQWVDQQEQAGIPPLQTLQSLGYPVEGQAQAPSAAPQAIPAPMAGVGTAYPGEPGGAPPQAPVMMPPATPQEVVQMQPQVAMAELAPPGMAIGQPPQPVGTPERPQAMLPGMGIPVMSLPPVVTDPRLTYAGQPMPEQDPSMISQIGSAAGQFGNFAARVGAGMLGQPEGAFIPEQGGFFSRVGAGMIGQPMGQPTPQPMAQQPVPAVGQPVAAPQPTTGIPTRPTVQYGPRPVRTPEEMAELQRVAAQPVRRPGTEVPSGDGGYLGGGPSAADRQIDLQREQFEYQKGLTEAAKSDVMTPEIQQSITTRLAGVIDPGTIGMQGYSVTDTDLAEMTDKMQQIQNALQSEPNPAIRKGMAEYILNSTLAQKLREAARSDADLALFDRMGWERPTTVAIGPYKSAARQILAWLEQDATRTVK